MLGRLYKNDRAFQQIENERFVFYPWGRPGKGLVVSKKQRTHIKIASGFISFLFVCVFYTGLVKYNAGETSFAIWLWASSLILYQILIAIYFMIFTKFHKLVVHPDPVEEGLSGALKIIIATLFAEAILLFLGLNISSS